MKCLLSANTHPHKIYLSSYELGGQTADSWFFPCDPHKSNIYLSAVTCGQLRTDNPRVKFYVHSKLPSFSCGACHIAIFYKLQSQGSSGQVI